jgi:hypothetical protein
MKHEVITPSETDTLFTDLSRPSLLGLSYALRHSNTWPDGFLWNYGRCPDCAMGLAAKLWREIMIINWEWCSELANAFSMPKSDAYKIFVAASKERGWGNDMHRITPEMVADDIDEYLARRGSES